MEDKQKSPEGVEEDARQQRLALPGESDAEKEESGTDTEGRVVAPASPLAEKKEAVAEPPEAEPPQAESPEAESPEGEPPEGDDLAPIPQLQQEICRLFPQVARVELIRLHEVDSTILAVVLLQDGTVDREALGKRLVTHCAAKSITLFPALYAPQEWEKLDRAMPEMRWLDSLEEHAGHVALVDLYRQHRQYPGDLRRMLSKSIQHHLAFFDFIQRSLLFPSHLCLAFSETVLRESLELLYATKGLVFTPDVATIEVFEEHFVEKDSFSSGHILLYFQVAGLVKQSRHYYQHTLDEEPAFDWLLIAKQICQFLNVFKNHVLQTFSTGEERRQLRLRRAIIAGGIALATVVAFVWYLVATWPLSPIEDLRVITTPGGIVGHYFKDKQLKHKVLERTDSTISLSTYGHPDREKKVPKDQFSARWKGYIRFTTEGKYVLCSEDDDGVRVYLNNELFIDDWKAARRKTCKPVRVSAGWYPLKVEFFDNTHGAVMRLLRGETEQRARLVPSQDLCCQKTK